MLESLYIKDFILIQQLNMEFNNDFSAFTGETGAGKSIFIDAISCLIGERVSSNYVRNNASKAIIEGVFTIDENIKNKLIEAGYDDSTFIVTREINADGKSTIRLNQRITTASFVKECIGDYIDIHNQHENQYLLNEKYHLSLLDSYCQIDDKLVILKDKYNKYKELDNKLNDLLNNEYNSDQIDLLKYQISEIDSLNLKIGEDDQLEETIKNYSQIDKLKSLKERLDNLVSDNALTNLYQAIKEMSILDAQDIKDDVSNINDNYYSIVDSYENISNYLDNLTNDAVDINELNERLFEIQRLKRKHHLDIEGLLQLSIDNKQIIENYQNKEETISKLKKEIDNAYNEFYEYAQLISSIRKDKANLLAAQIQEQLIDLNLENALFKCEFKEDKASSKGIDNVIFMVSMNPGMPLAPLSKTASGGELSRLMLGLKTIFARLSKTKLVIFDEIDTGVSGKVAFSIGKKMHEISNDIQVFAITHLPAVAANADNHYKISKIQDDNSTSTILTKLTAEQRVNELAILSNSTISNSSLQAARELLQRGQQH